MNLKQKHKLANQTANLIINIILKMKDDDLIQFLNLILEELKKRGIEDVRCCSDFFD